ncbi:transcriptional repressor TCF25-domain-containing protein [Tuber indicum]|nr:transcriptional repressor TCF25-domain-containing protein [Tuber indicum]
MPIDSVLTVEPKNFDANAEMRILFGRAAMPEPEGEIFPGRRGGRQRGSMRGRDGRVIGGRRNIFVQPKGTAWPNATSVGLGMDVVSVGLDGGPTEFRFVHSTAYQDVQRQFKICVESMDPDRMIQLLRHNPYHIASLLQVSEISSQQRNHESSGDFLERALFAFGRSVNSTFSARLSEGKARLSFLLPENREFWLACWRYISNLIMRGTWRAAEEFGRMLLALDPERDPYQICLIIDMLALNARRPERFLTLVEHPEFVKRHAHLPNIAFSTALAYHQLHKDALAREYLAKAITRFPWVLKRLSIELSIRHQPNTPLAAEILPPDALHSILAELFVERTKDLWKGADTKRLLADVAGSIYSLPKKSFRAPPMEPSNLVEFDGVSIDVARHILSTGNRGVIQYLPREWIRVPTISYDPLPPVDSIGTAPLSYLQNLVSSVAPILERARAVGGDEGDIGDIGEEEFRRLMEQLALEVEGASGGNTADENTVDGDAAIRDSNDENAGEEGGTSGIIQSLLGLVRGRGGTRPEGGGDSGGTGEI